MKNPFSKVAGVVSVPLKIAAFYFVVGVLWVLFSDKTLGLLVHDPGVLTDVSILKGLCYVLATALMLYVLVARGVSQIAHSQEQARFSQVQYRELVESANSVIMRRDITGRITFVNEFALDFFGYSEEEIIGRNVVGTIVPDVDSSGRNLKEMIEDIGKHPERYTNNENENVKSNGDRVWIAWSNRPIRDENGRITEILCIGNDITRRKQVEEEALRAKKEWEQTFDAVPDLIAILDKDYRVLRVNKAMAAKLGMTPGECVGLACYEAVHGSHEPPFFCPHKQLLSDGLEHTEEVFEKRLGGDFIVSVSPLYDTDGELEGSVHVCRDITERKLAEEKLRESDARLKIAMDIAKLVQWEYDVETGMFNFDEQFYALYGTSSEQEGGQMMPAEVYAGRFVPPEESNVVAEEIAKALATTDPNFTNQLEHRIIRADGQIRHIIVRYVVVCDQTAKVVKVRGANQDITERKRAEEELKEQERKYRTLFEAANDGIFLLSTTGVVDCNENAARMYGIPRENLIGRLPQEFSPEMQSDGRPSSEVASEKIRAAFDGRPQAFEWQSLRSDGVLFELDITLNRIYVGNSVLLLAILRDITERKLAAEEKEKLQAQLYQAQKMESVGRLAGGVAHDFNNMLGIIIGRAEMVLLKEVSADIHEDLVDIIKAGKRSADLTRQLLAFARRQTAMPRVLDLNDTISGMLKMLLRLIGEDIKLSWAPGLDLWKVKIDPAQVDQILANLAVNARDAICGVGAVTIQTENVVIDQVKRDENPEFIPGDYVLLTVSDTGAGMSEGVCEKIFEPFFTTKELGKGTGLGLSIVYGIVKQNDGFVCVASKPGEGASFQIYLPRYEGEAEQVKSAAVPFKAPTGAESILLVEDDEALLRLGKAMLERLGYTVLAAHTPIFALQLAQDQQVDIDLLITDVVMPGMNGRELVEKVRAVRPGLKCLFMSGYPADVVAHQGVLDEGLNFIQKPFVTNDLAAKVRKVLDE